MLMLNVSNYLLSLRLLGALLSTNKLGVLKFKVLTFMLKLECKITLVSLHILIADRVCSNCHIMLVQIILLLSERLRTILVSNDIV